MLKRIKEEGIIYIVIFALSQITMMEINPIGIAATCSAIACGCSIKNCVFFMIVGLSFVHKIEIIKEYVIVVVIFSIMEYLFRKYKVKADEITKSMLLMVIFFVVNIMAGYQDLMFVKVLVMLLEVLIASCVCMVLSVGILYVKERKIIKNLKLQEKISLSVLFTLIGVYVIQARKEYVTPLKIVVLYLMAFSGVMLYKVLVCKNYNHRKLNYSYNTYAYSKLVEYAEVIRNIARSIGVLSRDNLVIEYEKGNAIFEKVSSKYCSECDRSSVCWDKEFKSTYNAVNIMVDKGVKNGEVSIKDLPRNFMIRCKYINDFLIETNAGFELEKNNIRWRKKMNEMKNIMMMQLNELADSLCEFNNVYSNDILLNAYLERRIKHKLRRNDIYVRDIYFYKNGAGIKELCLSVRSLNGRIVKSRVIAEVVSDVLKEEYEVKSDCRDSVYNVMCEIVLLQKSLYEIVTSFKGLKKEGEILCGDNYTVIEDSCGQSAMILSDGMGTGRVAFEESCKTIELVEELLRAGFAKDIAIRLLNSAMYINSFDSNIYATIDVCVIDNYKGECEFIKNGAAPSFIKQGNDVSIIRSNSLPIGVFNSTDYDVKKYKLNDGDVIVMITDGLEECMPDYYDSTSEIKRILEGIKSNNPKVIANKLVETCVTNKRIKDDISILVGIIWKKY